MFLAVLTAIRDLASQVFVPKCGKITQLWLVFRGCVSGSGSGSVTSRPAPPIISLDKAVWRSSWFTMAPRAELIKIAFFFIFSKLSKLKKPLVWGVTAQQMHRISDCVRSSSWDTKSAIPSAKLAGETSLYMIRDTPNGFILLATPKPTRPKPNIPSVLPIVVCPRSHIGFQEFTSPALMASSPINK